MNKLQTLWQLYSYFGTGWLTYRLGYALRIRSGWLRHQLPVARWEDQSLTGFLSDTHLVAPEV